MIFNLSDKERGQSSHVYNLIKRATMSNENYCESRKSLLEAVLQTLK